MSAIRAGDTVTHGPSGETWLVAAVSDRELAPAGWPPSIALRADCVLVEGCTDDEHRDMVRRADGHATGQVVGAGHTCDVCGGVAPLDRQSDRRTPSRSKARDTSMTLRTLEAGVRETLAYGVDLRTDALHMAFGLAEEAGEVARKFRRVLRGDPGADMSDPQWLAAVSGEIGDTLWYVVALADVLGLSMDDVAAQLLEQGSGRAAGLGGQPMTDVPQYPDADDDPIGTRMRRSDEAHAALATLDEADRVRLEVALHVIRTRSDLGAVLQALAIAEATANAAHDALDRLEGVPRTPPEQRQEAVRARGVAEAAERERGRVDAARRLLQSLGWTVAPPEGE